MEDEDVRVPAEELEPFARRLTAALGVPEEVAGQVAASLVAADLRGHRSHGTIRLARFYPDMIDQSGIDPSGIPEVAREAGATATVDGNRAFGHAVGRFAVDVAAERAEEAGVAAVGVRNAAHLGRIGEWAERAAERGLVFAAFVNTGSLAELVAAPGSATRRLGTNPIAFGVPSFGAVEFPLVLDIATSQVAHGKVTKRHVEEEAIPPEWVTDPQGATVTDPAVMEEGEGAMLPLGGTTAGYKGFGLATIAELLAGVLGDAPVAGGTGAGHRVNNAAAFFAADPDRFSDPAENRERVETLADHIRDSEFAEEVSPGDAAYGDTALLPGEAEHLTRRERAAAGIPIARETLDLLAALADEVGVEDVPPSIR